MNDVINHSGRLVLIRDRFHADRRAPIRYRVRNKRTVKCFCPHYSTAITAAIAIAITMLVIINNSLVILTQKYISDYCNVESDIFSAAASQVLAKIQNSELWTKSLCVCVGLDTTTDYVVSVRRSGDDANQPDGVDNQQLNIRKVAADMSLFSKKSI